ncbi:MAG: DUF2306 domain-containing protein [Proteobacteria bacterium]|nr:DUF2306 domain-containing protein [Pseudomonadota bacterium]
MHDGHTQVLGLVVHSDDPLFLTMVGLHVIVGLVAVLAGLVAMFSPKRRGRHSRWGTTYFWATVAIFSSATVLTYLRGPEDFRVLALGAAAFASAWVGRSARRGRWHNSVRVHIAGMGMSYVFMLTAFYVETGDQLPIWKDLPSILYWVLPVLVGLPLIARALIRNSPARAGP